MRLGGPIFEPFNDPDSWVDVVKKAGYRTAFCPLGENASDAEIQAYAAAAKKADIVIAEVGAWSSPLSPDDQMRKDSLEKCKKSLALAEKISARCCVNIAGSRGQRWEGPHPDILLMKLSI